MDDQTFPPVKLLILKLELCLRLPSGLGDGEPPCLVVEGDDEAEGDEVDVRKTDVRFCKAYTTSNVNTLGRKDGWSGWELLTESLLPIGADLTPNSLTDVPVHNPTGVNPAT